MTDIDIVAELRRLAGKMAQTPLEHAEGHFESIDEMVTYFAGVASQRPEHLFLHVVQSVDSVDDGGDGIIAITGNGFLSDVHADVFVAVPRYLPALLDVVEAARRVANTDSTLSDLYMLRDKLAALKQDGAS